MQMSPITLVKWRLMHWASWAILIDYESWKEINGKQDIDSFLVPFESH